MKAPALSNDSVRADKPNRMRSDGARIRVGSYSREGAFALLDKRSAPALFLKRQREALNRQLANSPTAAEAAIIDRCCFLMLRLAQLDAKLVTGEFTEHDNAHYLAWSNCLTRALARLGFKAAQPKHRSLAEILVDLDPRTEEPA